MVIVMIILYFIGREITLLVCLSLCNGTWNKIKTNVKPNNLIERVFLSFLLKAKTQYTTIVSFGVVSANVEIINTILCIVFYLLNFKTYLLIWGIIWLLHFSILIYMYRKSVR